MDELAIGGDGVHGEFRVGVGRTLGHGFARILDFTGADEPAIGGLSAGQAGAPAPTRAAEARPTTSVEC